MKKRILFASSIAAIVFLFAAASGAGELDEGKRMMDGGNLQGAAEFFNAYASKNPSDSENSAEALAMAGRILDVMADPLTGQAEKSCYWGKGGGSAECMQRFASQFNARFGEGAFRHDAAVNFVAYTGSHYRRIASQYPKSRYAPEADFYLLLRDLVGQPEEVEKRVKAFLSKYPKGEWNRKGLLLWARINEDIWHVYRKQGWFLSNSRVSPEDMIIRAEAYRKEALGTYAKLMRESGTFEGAAAAREHGNLMENREDSVTYSIVNDSTPGSLSAWGISQPSASSSSQEGRGASAAGESPAPPAVSPAPPKSVPQIRSAPASGEPEAPLPPPPTPEKGELKRPPSRWN